MLGADVGKWETIVGYDWALGGECGLLRGVLQRVRLRLGVAREEVDCSKIVVG